MSSLYIETEKLEKKTNRKLVTFFITEMLTSLKLSD